jgi:hypothetical protein
MNNYILGSSISFLIFNRPDTTRRVMSEIRRVRPAKLLVIADGPRPDHPTDKEKCAETRAIINEIDWPCEVLTNYSEINLGCKRRVSSGLNWVFSLVDHSIILEDDIIPDQSFFRYCDELLELYANDQRIGAICGANFQKGVTRSSASYYFSAYYHVWGWASWSRAWKHYDVDMKLWPEIRDTKFLCSLFPNQDCLKYWSSIFDTVYQQKIDTWDYQWVFSCCANSMLSILPNVNLVRNIGMGPNATHTTDVNSPYGKIPVRSMVFPLVHPQFVMRNEDADEFFLVAWEGVGRKAPEAENVGETFSDVADLAPEAENVGETFSDVADLAPEEQSIPAPPSLLVRLISLIYQEWGLFASRVFGKAKNLMHWLHLTQKK